MLKARSTRSSDEKTDGRSAARPQIESASALQRLADGSPVVSRLQRLGALYAPMQRHTHGVQQFAGGVLQRMNKPAAENQKLKNIIDALFKNRPAGGNKIGDGSAMAAANEEAIAKANGRKMQVGDADHIKKLDSILNGLENLMDRHENPRSPFRLSDEDYATAEMLFEACSDAQVGDYDGDRYP
jgi:hypothetical protein